MPKDPIRGLPRDQRPAEAKGPAQGGVAIGRSGDARQSLTQNTTLQSPSAAEASKRGSPPPHANARSKSKGGGRDAAGLELIRRRIARRRRVVLEASAGVELSSFSFQGTYEFNRNYIVGGVMFNQTGSRMYITTDTGTSGYFYFCDPATPYTAEDFLIGDFTLINNNWGSVRPRDCCWNSDGTGVIVSTLGQNAIQEYLHGGTAYNFTSFGDLTSDNSTGTLAVGEQDPLSHALSPDGTVLAYVTNETGKDIIYGTLSTPFDVSTWSRVGKWQPTEGDMRFIRFSSDGTRVLVLSSDGNTLYQFNLSTAYDISTVSANADDTLDFSANKDPAVTLIVGFALSPDDTTIYTIPFDATTSDAQMEVYQQA